MSAKQYDALDTLPDLDGGVFARQLSAAMAKTAMAVVQQEGRARKGKVTIERLKSAAPTCWRRLH